MSAPLSYYYSPTVHLIYNISGRECQAAHRKAHKKECKKRAPDINTSMANLSTIDEEECLISPNPEDMVEEQGEIFVNPYPRSPCRCGKPLCSADQPSVSTFHIIRYATEYLIY